MTRGQRPKSMIALPAAMLSMGAGMINYGQKLAARQGERLATSALTYGAKSAYNYAYPKSKPKRKTKNSGPKNFTPGNNFTKTTTKLGRRKPRTMKAKINKNSALLNTMMQSQVYRAQYLTNHDVDGGGIPLRFAYDSVSTQVDVPLHIYDLSSFNNASLQVAGYSYSWDSEADTANIVRTAVPIQAPAGSVISTGEWRTEDAPVAENPMCRAAHHKWSDIRFNFYGAHKRTTWFEVIFFTVRDEFADPFKAAVSNNDLKLLIQYLTRPCIFSSIQTDSGGNTRNKIRIVKRYKYFVAAKQTIDSAAHKMKEARIFMNHDRIRGYDWSYSNSGGLLGHTVNDGRDFVNDTDVHNSPEFGKRLYMAVRAFAPERAEAAGTPIVDNERDPTYDFLIRNKFAYIPGANNTQ